MVLKRSRKAALHNDKAGVARLISSVPQALKGTDGEGCTVLIRAAEQSLVDTTGYLIKSQADINAAWQDELDIAGGRLDPAERKTFDVLLLGQSGSGKTAIVQAVVLDLL